MKLKRVLYKQELEETQETYNKPHTSYRAQFTF